jgi:hypothetical protein
VHHGPHPRARSKTRSALGYLPVRPKAGEEGVGRS